MKKKICIITGGLLNVHESSAWNAIRKQISQLSQGNHRWLELKIKLLSAEPILLSRMTKKSEKVKEYFLSSGNENLPELTEVVLADELSKLNVPFEILTYDDLFSHTKKADFILSSCDVVFASSTLLHDLSEAMPLLTRIKKHNVKIVLGGALTGSLYKCWPGDPMVDILAIGYGEFLVPHLVDWMYNGYEQLTSPPQGKLLKNDHTIFLFSGSPLDRNLDNLPTPDWRVAEKYHNKSFTEIYYESVRGCPYRCSFCNYPYLFDDNKFRVKSAEKMADDWQYYSDHGVKSIICLDSLFTMPKKRLIKFCELLIEKNINIKWACYARADDLLEDDVVALMKKAGVNHLQIGLESGNQELLDAMNKQCTVDKNLIAIQMCRKHNITSLVSLIVGFPGETAETIRETYEFKKKAKPDFHFLATFSVRVEDVPVLNVENRQKFGLHTMKNPFTFAPYWKHNTMSCSEVGGHVRYLNEQLCNEKISLDGSVFYTNISHYVPSYREDLLEFQFRAMNEHKMFRPLFDLAHHFIDKKLKKDVMNWEKDLN